MTTKMRTRTDQGRPGEHIDDDAMDDGRDDDEDGGKDGGKGDGKGGGMGDGMGDGKADDEEDKNGDMYHEKDGNGDNTRRTMARVKSTRHPSEDETRARTTRKERSKTTKMALTTTTMNIPRLAGRQRETAMGARKRVAQPPSNFGGTLSAARRDLPDGVRHRGSRLSHRRIAGCHGPRRPVCDGRRLRRECGAVVRKSRSSDRYRHGGLVGWRLWSGQERALQSYVAARSGKLEDPTQSPIDTLLALAHGLDIPVHGGEGNGG